MKAVVGQQAVRSADVLQCFDLEAGMKGELVQIRVFADDAPLDQDPVGTDADLLAPLLCCGEQRRSEHMAQAIEFDRGTGLASSRPVVVL